MGETIVVYFWFVGDGVVILGEGIEVEIIGVGWGAIVWGIMEMLLVILFLWIDILKLLFFRLNFVILFWEIIFNNFCSFVKLIVMNYLFFNIIKYD